mmetsp:Transcript_74962/g.132846  ORF Transcript_74962/g.132846 Transcript_74962/m.132846 type:complete len:82 (+) Transcript_74962:386-631(+)
MYLKPDKLISMAFFSIFTNTLRHVPYQAIQTPMQFLSILALFLWHSPYIKPLEIHSEIEFLLHFANRFSIGHLPFASLIPC